MNRFMDDILMVYAQTPRWDFERFVADFVASECYQKPLTLEEGKDGTFLETRFWVDEASIKYKLKNDNEGGKNNVWRYQHWYSNTAFTGRSCKSGPHLPPPYEKHKLWQVTLSACVREHLTK